MLSNKVIVITGGAGLLGREFCKTVVHNNGICILADFDQKNGQQVVFEIKAVATEAVIEYQFIDINSKFSINELIHYLKSKFNRIDAVVNNAYPRNKNYGREFFDVEYDDFCENLSINLGGYFLVGQQFASYFIQQGFGNIINISSIYGVIAPRFEVYEETKMTMPVEYAAIKSALIQLTKYMAKYLKGKNIRVNAISLGGLFDNQPISFLEAYKSYCLNKGMLDKSDVNGTLVYLLTDQSTFVNGQNLIIDDGFTL